MRQRGENKLVHGLPLNSALAENDREESVGVCKGYFLSAVAICLLRMCT